MISLGRQLFLFYFAFFLADFVFLLTRLRSTEYRFTTSRNRIQPKKRTEVIENGRPNSYKVFKVFDESIVRRNENIEGVTLNNCVPGLPWSPSHIPIAHGEC